MQDEIKTTGNLRRYLAEIMKKVEAGEIEPDKASRITKLAGQINESFYSEIKVARVMVEAGKEAAKLGTLNIGQ